MKKPLKNMLFRYRWWWLLGACLLFVAYQCDNTPRIDDEYLGEQVYWLIHHGKVQSELGYSQLGYDRYQSIFHKLFIYTGYLSCRLNGWSLLSLHMVSLVCFPVFLFLFYRYNQKMYGSANNYHFFGVALLLLCNQDLLYASGDFRPEIMILVMGFAAYSLLLCYLKEGRSGLLIASAFCSGLCMFAHLNGIIFILAGCVLLLSVKGMKAAMAYGFLAMIAFLPYFTDVLVHADLDYFRHQFMHDPVLNIKDNHWYTPLLKILNEQVRFLFTEQQMLLTAILLTTFCFSFKQLRKTHKELLIYTLVLVIAMAVVNPSKSTKYMVMYLPFLYIIIVEGWHFAEQQAGRKLKLIIRSLLAASISLSLFYSCLKIGNNILNWRTGGIIAEHKTIALKIRETHKDVSLLAPRIMVFNELGNFRCIRDIALVDPRQLRSFITSSDIRFIIFSAAEERRFNLPQLLQDPDSLLQMTGSTEHYKLVAVNRK